MRQGRSLLDLQSHNSHSRVSASHARKKKETARSLLLDCRCSQMKLFKFHVTILRFVWQGGPGGPGTPGPSGIKGEQVRWQLLYRD